MGMVGEEIVLVLSSGSSSAHRWSASLCLRTQVVNLHVGMRCGRLQRGRGFEAVGRHGSEGWRWKWKSRGKRDLSCGMDSRTRSRRTLWSSVVE